MCRLCNAPCLYKIAINNELELSRTVKKNCITFKQCRTDVEDVEPTLYKCYTNVLCLLGRPMTGRRVEVILFIQQQLGGGGSLVLWLKLPCLVGGGPRVVVSTAAFHARVWGSVPGLGGLKETNNVSSPSTCENQYCRGPPRPRGSVLGLRAPGREFRILCLDDSLISIISPSSGGSPGPI